MREGTATGSLDANNALTAYFLWSHRGTGHGEAATVAQTFPSIFFDDSCFILFLFWSFDPGALGRAGGCRSPLGLLKSLARADTTLIWQSHLESMAPKASQNALHSLALWSHYKGVCRVGSYFLWIFFRSLYYLIFNLSAFSFPIEFLLKYNVLGDERGDSRWGGTAAYLQVRQCMWSDKFNWPKNDTGKNYNQSNHDHAPWIF